MATIFSRIISGEIPCYKIAENEKFLAFLDAFPLTNGHALVVPKIEVDYIFDLPDELLREILLFSRPIAKAIEAAVPCARVGVSVIGLEVPHAHVHLLPISHIGDMDFRKERPRFTAEQFEATAVAIRSKL